MVSNFIIGGIIISPLVPQLVVSVLLTGLISVLLMRFGFYRMVWHRPLIEVSLFCIILGGIVALTPEGTPVGSALNDVPHAVNSGLQ